MWYMRWRKRGEKRMLGWAHTVYIAQWERERRRCNVPHTPDGTCCEEAMQFCRPTPCDIYGTPTRYSMALFTGKTSQCIASLTWHLGLLFACALHVGFRKSTPPGFFSNERLRKVAFPARPFLVTTGKPPSFIFPSIRREMSWAHSKDHSKLGCPTPAHPQMFPAVGGNSAGRHQS